MLTLITATPGQGKTALAVKMLKDAVGTRPLYVDGIKELKIDHLPVPHIDQWVKRIQRDNGADDYEWIGFAPGALIVIDECQRMFRPRAPSAKVPDVIAGFETHRHAGLDFLLITQDSTFLDSNVRKLLDRHIHIQDSWLGRFSYTWLKEGDPKTKSSLDQASRSKYRIPKESFPLYKSAEVHTERKRPIPLVLPLGILALIAFVVLAWRIVSSVSSRNEVVAAEKKFDVPGEPGQVQKVVKGMPDESRWRVVGWIEGATFRVVLSDGKRQRIIIPESFRRVGLDLETTLPGGEVVSSWSGGSQHDEGGKTWTR